MRILCFVSFCFHQRSQYGKSIVPYWLRLILVSHPSSTYRVQMQQAQGCPKASQLPGCTGTGEHVFSVFTLSMHPRYCKTCTFPCFLYSSHLPSTIRGWVETGHGECLSAGSPRSRLRQGCEHQCLVYKVKAHGSGSGEARRVREGSQ